MKRESEF